LSARVWHAGVAHYAIPDALLIGRVIEGFAVLVECAAPAELQSLVIYLPL